MRKNVTIYTDGSSRGNPGPGGYGVILIYTDDSGITHHKTLTDGYPRTTNNRMELLAAIKGLEYLKEPVDVELYSDSEYLTNGFNKGWLSKWKLNRWKSSTGKSVKNQDLWKYLDRLSQKHNVKYIWVKGHDGNPYNEECDKMAVKSAMEALESVKFKPKKEDDDD